MPNKLFIAFIVYILLLTATSSCNLNPTNPDKVETPTFSHVGGYYDSYLLVEISCATNGATIRYTEDGSDPTSHSRVFRNHVWISFTTTL